MEKFFKVAEHVFKLELDSGLQVWKHLDNYAPFEIDGSDKVLFSLGLTDSAPEGDFELFFDPETEKGETVVRIYRSSVWWMFEMATCSDSPICARLYTTADFSKGMLLPLGGFTKDLQFAINNSLMLQFAFSTAKYDTLEMHASVVKCDGWGYLSLGRSGAGKSTHSRQWLQYVPGSSLLNDDNPVIRVIDGQVMVFGSPWSGKTPCYINDSCPAGAFIKIVQDPENVITRMSMLNSYAILTSSCSGLHFDENSSDGLHATFEKVLATVPFWELRCRADEQAAKVCSAAVRRG